MSNVAINLFLTTLKFEMLHGYELFEYFCVITLFYEAQLVRASLPVLCCDERPRFET